MIYVIAIAAIITLLARAFAPVRHSVRASQPTGDARSTDKWIAHGFAVGTDGKSVDTEGRFVGLVDGPSMERHGLPKGATFIADYLHGDIAQQVAVLRPGDIVVVLDKHDTSPDGSEEYCLRRIKSIVGTTIEYYDDHDVDAPIADSECSDKKPLTLVAVVTTFIPKTAPKSLFEYAKAA